MVLSLSELIPHCQKSDHGWCLNHILHLAAIQIVNPFNAKPDQLDWALAEAMHELEAAGNDLTSVGSTEEGEETEE